MVPDKKRNTAKRPRFRPFVPDLPAIGSVQERTAGKERAGYRAVISWARSEQKGAGPDRNGPFLSACRQPVLPPSTGFLYTLEFGIRDSVARDGVQRRPG